MINQDKHVTVNQLAILSLFIGVAVASLLPILLNFQRLEYMANVLMWPGGMLSSLVAPREIVPHPMLLLAGSALFYASCVFTLMLIIRSWITASKIRLSLGIIGFVAIVLLGLTFVPQVNPLWPHGMNELGAREEKLRSLILAEMTIDQVRAILERESLPLNEQTVRAPREIMRNREAQIAASAGDQLLSSRVRTKAIQYPCGYDLQVIVLFNADGRMKSRYIGRLPVCP